MYSASIKLNTNRIFLDNHVNMTDERKAIISEKWLEYPNRLKHMIIHGFLHLIGFNHEENHFKKRNLKPNLFCYLGLSNP